MRILDPTYETTASKLEPAKRSASLEGSVVGVISNGKEGTRPFFGHLEEFLRRELGVAEVVLRTKSSYSAPAETEILDEATRWAAVFTGLGD